MPEGGVQPPAWPAPAGARRLQQPQPPQLRHRGVVLGAASRRRPCVHRACIGGPDCGDADRLGVPRLVNSCLLLEKCGFNLRGQSARRLVRVRMSHEGHERKAPARKPHLGGQAHEAAADAPCAAFPAAKAAPHFIRVLEQQQPPQPPYLGARAPVAAAGAPRRAAPAASAPAAKRGMSTASRTAHPAATAAAPPDKSPDPSPVFPEFSFGMLSVRLPAGSVLRRAQLCAYGRHDRRRTGTAAGTAPWAPAVAPRQLLTPASVLLS